MVDAVTTKLVQLRELLDRMVDAIITLGRALGWAGTAGVVGGALIWLGVFLMTSSSTPARGFLLVFFALAPVPGLLLLWWRRLLLAATTLRVDIADRLGTIGNDVTTVAADLPRGPWRRLLTLAWRARKTVTSASGLAMDVTPILRAGNPWMLLAVVICLPLAITTALVGPLALLLGLVV